MQKDVLFGDDGDGNATRILCVGGPLDGDRIATTLYFRTGRGKATTHISIPIWGEVFDVVVDDGTEGHYVYNDERRAYWFVAGRRER